MSYLLVDENVIHPPPANLFYGPTKFNLPKIAPGIMKTSRKRIIITFLSGKIEVLEY